MLEEWCDHPDYVGYLQVTKTGNVRSIDRISQAGRRLKGRILKQTTVQSGHKRVFIVHPDGKTISGRDVQVLVLETYVGPRPSCNHEARHVNGIPDDNRLKNLAWGTKREQRLDDIINGANVQMHVTHCPLGHEYTVWNNSKSGKKYELGNGSGNRTCRSCGNARSYARRKKLDFDLEVANFYYERHEKEWKREN